MAQVAQIRGIRIVLANIRRSQDKVEAGVARGLKKAGLHLQRVSMRLAPVEFGNLKASAYTRAQGQGFKTEVFVGYTAAYALYVHEAVRMVLKGQPRVPNPPHKGKYWDPQGRAQAKFLEAPARTEEQKMAAIVNAEAKL